MFLLYYEGHCAFQIKNNNTDFKKQNISRFSLTFFIILLNLNDLVSAASDLCHLKMLFAL